MDREDRCGLPDASAKEGRAALSEGVPTRSQGEGTLLRPRHRLGEKGGLDSLLDLFSKTRIAEMASYAQIAYERVGAIQKLDRVLREEGDEPALQRIVSQAPWLIDPTWTPITANQSLGLFARGFAAFYEQRGLASDLPEGWVVALVCDGVGIGDPNKSTAFEHWESAKAAHRANLVDRLPGARREGQ